MQKTIISLFSLTLLFSLFHKGTTGQITPTSPVNEVKCRIKLTNSKIEPVSNYLMGFNTVYAYEADSVWSDGKIEKYLKDVNVSLIRYPGGTVSSFYHWDKLTGEGWKDNWDPENPVKIKPETAFMDLKEFMVLARRLHITPLMGINMSSGRRWNLTEQGIKEALDLMKYCRDNKFEVKYWYLDNEPYQKDSNGGSKTIEEYADMINSYVPRMKQFDPAIKIIVNWNAGFKNRKEEYQKLFKIAGKNIDIVDVHWYWSWGKPTFDKFLSKTPLQTWTGETYLNEIGSFRRLVKESGFPEIKLASLEWNVGPIRENQLSPSQCALIQAEMLMEFMSGGLDMATFWPIHGPGGTVQARSFINKFNKEAHPIYPIMEFLGKIQGTSLIQTKEVKNTENVFYLFSSDPTNQSLRIALLNKNNKELPFDIESELLNSANLVESSVYVLSKGGNEGNFQKVKSFIQSGTTISLTAPAISLIMLTFKL